MSDHLRILYPEIEPYSTEMLAVGDGHQLYIEQCGNPDGVPVIFLHGGPGGHTKPKHRRLFNPEKYRIILFDQRGCGRSTPFGSLENNQTENLVSDINKIRKHFNIDTWCVFGGSWGSTLGMAYVAAYPQHVSSVVLYGIFLGRESEMIHFVGNKGLAAQIYPDAYERFLTVLTDEEKSDPLQSYAALIADRNNLRHKMAVRSWCLWESILYAMDAAPLSEIQSYLDQEEQAGGLPVNALFESTYLSRFCYLDADVLLAKLGTLGNISVTLVQGRMDLVCPPQTAWDVHKAWPNSKLVIIPHEGHANDTPGMLDTLITATDAMVKR